MTNFTNEQLESWAGLTGFIEGYSDRHGYSVSNLDDDDLYCVTSAPALAAALLAERKAREVEVGELHRALALAGAAINAAYMQSDAEWRGHDKVADRHDKIVREGRSAIHQALKGQRDE